MIQIYSKGNKNFQQNGDVTLLSDDAIVRVELNGAWNLELHHPIDEKGRWKYLVEDAVIKAPSFNGEQLFRIYNKEKSDDGVSVQAYPIFFDAKNDCFLVDVRPTNKNGQDALNIMCSVNSKYSASSDIARMNTSYFEYMNLLEAINGDSQNSFLRRWGGEVLYDNFKIIVNEKVGGDYGVEIRYGKNIPANGVREEIDMSEVVTRIYPKAFNGRKLTSGFVDSPIIGNYETVRATTMKFENIKLREDVEGDGTKEGIIICDTQAELDAELTKKCKEQFEFGLDKPKITIDADMVLLQNTEEYKDYKILEKVSLGDTVHCKHNKLGIVTDARVISLEYDCLLDRVTSVKLGDFKKNYFNDVTDNVNKIESVITPEGGLVADKVEGILNAMKTQLKYQKDIAHKQDVRAIFFEDLDTDSPTYGAMCLGTQGFQISNKRTADGRDWDWTTAFTANGGYANAIITGKLSDKTGKNFWDLETGEFKITSKTLIGEETLEDMINSNKNVIESDSEPIDKSKIWLDTSVDPPLFKKWSGDGWKVVNDTTSEIESLRTEMQKEIGTTADGIKLEVAENYYTKDEAGKLEKSIGTQFEQTNADFEFKFNEYGKDLSDLEKHTNEELSTISKHIRFVDGNIEMMATDSVFKRIMTREKDSYYENGVEIAYFGNRKLFVKDGEFIDSCQIGNFGYIPEKNGSLSFRRVR